MENNKFYAFLSLVFSFSGFICSIIIYYILWSHKTEGVRFGNSPYAFFSIVIIVSFILNMQCRKNLNNKNLIAYIGMIIAILSLSPIIIFLISFVFALLIAPLLIML